MSTSVKRQMAQFIPPPLGECVPAGTYKVGSLTSPAKRKADVALSDEQVGEFQLGQYPVTNAEWRCFMEAGGYKDESLWKSKAAKLWRSGKNSYECWEHWWGAYRTWMRDRPGLVEDLGRVGDIHPDEVEAMTKRRDESDADFEAFLKIEKEKPEQMRVGELHQPAGFTTDFDNDLQPVCGIGWFEAQAYCVWLSECTNEKWRLPTEIEWEIGARYGMEEHTLYPWGDEFDQERCNTVKNGILSTTPVGMYPNGATRSGLYDICGNVAEWTASKYNSYGDAADETETVPKNYALRVLRGGSWYYGQTYARLTFRLQYHPGFRARTAGFRVLRDWA